MPSTSYGRNADVLCPFYNFDDPHIKRIVCEGFVEDSTLAQTYLRKKDYQTQLRVFCCENYKKCEVYRMLMEKYEED